MGLELTIILLLIVANGFFAGGEIAVVAVRESRLRELGEKGTPGASAALALKRAPDRFLATVQVGITVVGMTAAAFGGASLARRLEPGLARVEWLAPYADDLALGIVVAGVSYLSVVIGELVPKSLALRATERMALTLAPPLRVLFTVSRPIVWLLSASARAVLAPFGGAVSGSDREHWHSARELQQIVREAKRSGSIHIDAGTIAARALDLPRLTAEDVMVHRQDVVSVPRDVSPDDLQRTLAETGHARLPVHEGTRDHVTGYLRAKDVHAQLWRTGELRLDDLLTPHLAVPKWKPAVDLLEEMRQRRAPLAIVVDEAGGMAGMVTMEDLLEELVGDIFNEHELMPESIDRDRDGIAVVDGRTPVRDLNRELGTRLPEGSGRTTVAGLCLALVDDIPAQGQRIEVEDGSLLQVLSATRRRVRTVRVVAPGARETAES